MRHRKKSEKFSRSRAQRKALIKSLLRAVVADERIFTTTSKAKYLRSEADRLITWAKRGSLSDRRLAFQVLGDHKLVKKLFDDIGPRFKNINGGYSRVLRAGTRKGDGASISLFELTRITKKIKSAKIVKEAVKPKSSESKEAKAPAKKEEKPKSKITSGIRKVFRSKKDTL